MTNMPADIGLGARTRRSVIGMALGIAGAVALAALPVFTPPAAAQATATAQKIADHFASIRSMTGEFVQFDARGRQTGGKFYIQRPGKVRFNYDGNAGFRVISDGDSVVLENPRMKTMDLYPLSKTPLKLLLNDRIDLSGNKVRSVKEEPDQTVIQLVDKSSFGNSRITMKFDPSNYELKEWTITDAQGKDTTVMIFNVRQDVKIDQSLFTIDYKKNIEINRKKSNR
ncbi:outer membrane lipoprotein carrier protein LolA [Mesorhizobium sp. LHD-90]|uniref:outer membrane lipoprotein carrier protein LolA n=1 Tax=Mesorhizobium sp. LHD-90 TaxID=3071414 RepID=UPI0027E1C139|nr:outer membrane lipoprotein carrier protein LolA [Mesorhizobium sp. LHD-90]MDQ6434054.1 outer membrane lipoprotein carrier protein LolA [Mesorhizobium sp. LHD-90]